MSQDFESLFQPELGDREVAEEPVEAAEKGSELGEPARRPDPTRYGDWEKGGRCIDF